MKVKFKRYKDKNMFHFIPIEFSVSNRGLPETRAVYFGTELGYSSYVVQFKWNVRKREDHK